MATYYYLRVERKHQIIRLKMNSKAAFSSPKRKSGKTCSVEFLGEYTANYQVNRVYNLYKKDDKGKDIEQSARRVVCSFNLNTRKSLADPLADKFADVENLLD